MCRPFLKGRDWFDFSWYIKRGVAPNLLHLKNALVQYGPWQGQDDLAVDSDWLEITVQEKIDSINWKEAIADVEWFLKPAELESLRLWSKRFFSKKLEAWVLALEKR